MKIKALKILQTILAVVGAVAFFFMVIVCGSKDAGVIFTYGVVGAILFLVGVLGVNAISNEIEYLEARK